MPDIEPGQQVIRLTNSTTGRSIYKGILGVIGGLDPGAHQNRVDRWPEYGFMPVQWTNGLWSNMEIAGEGGSWDFYPQRGSDDEEDNTGVPPNQSKVTNQMAQIMRSSQPTT